MGRSECGKTSLMQALRGEKLHYVKTQYTGAHSDVIDTPGEYQESKNVGVGLACFSFEADVAAIVIAADEPFSVFEPNCNCFLNRPLIGIITKIDAELANVPMVTQWLINSGCREIFPVSNVTLEGIPELKAYLMQETPKITIEEAIVKQSIGINDWDPYPDGTEEKMSITEAALSETLIGPGDELVEETILQAQEETEEEKEDRNLNSDR